MNTCENCRNKPYRNGAGGPCRGCVENSAWQNDREERHEAQAALTIQVGGNHYKDMPIQPVEYIHKNGIGYFEVLGVNEENQQVRAKPFPQPAFV